MYHDIILFFGGIVVGIMNAVAGGGMLIGFPLLLALGIPPLTANATSGLIVVPGSVSSAYGYRNLLKKVPRAYLLLLIPATVGAVIGSTLLRRTTPGSFEKLIPFLILFAVILFAIQPYLYAQLQAHLHGPKKKRDSVRPLVIVGIAVLPISIYGGYFGAGFGFIMLAFLGFTSLHNHIHRMNGLKNVIAICISLTSLLVLSRSHLIDWQHGLVMGGGTLLGGYYGSVGVQKVSSHTLRIGVIIIGICTATYLGLRSY